ncbi:MAG: haloacid dehalogenase-like hydrolase [Phycisphaerales bacterium]|nr:haloacid dehalogenase-like hydrolase [Phycisphaerales bacterium]
MTPASAPPDLDRTPLYVDLDGTLVALDTLHESLRRMVRRCPWRVPIAALGLVGGRSAFKEKVSALIELPIAELPYRASVVEYVRSARLAGQPAILATAATTRIAESVAEHLGLFDRVIASDRTSNRKGGEKLRAIRADVGDDPFDYAGDSRADLAIFAAARRSIVVCPSPAVRAQIGKSFTAHLLLDR